MSLDTKHQALILGEAHTTTAFERAHDFHELSISQMRRIGMAVTGIECHTWGHIYRAIGAVPDKSLKFLIIRGHGTATHIDLFGGHQTADMAHGVVLARNLIEQCFRGLREKMAADSFIVLEACSTGKIGKFDSIAMSFAMLMRGMDVRVIAPKDDSCECGIFLVDGKWKFTFLDDESKDELAVCYGPTVISSAAPCAADIAADTAPILYDMTTFNALRRDLRVSKKRQWAAGDVFDELVADAERFAEPNKLLARLLEFVSPADVCDFREEDRLLEDDIDYFHPSPLLKFLAKTKQHPESVVVGWMPIIAQWAEATEEAEHIKKVIADFGPSPLAESLRPKAAAAESV